MVRKRLRKELKKGLRIGLRWRRIRNGINLGVRVRG
jgi:hypothetical protein